MAIQIDVMRRTLLWGALIFSLSLGLGLWFFTASQKPTPTPNTNTNIPSTNGTIPSTQIPPSENTGTTPTPPSSSNGPTIYVSFASHNEDEHHPDYPNYVDDEATFWEHRANAIAYAQMLVSHGVKYNFQTDWNFLLAVQKYDTGDTTTNGKNILRYLHEDLGVDIDPHSHENNGYNFVDVAYLISELGVEPTGVVGGFIAGPAENSQLSYFWNLRNGKMYPNATWRPTLLWGAGTSQHQNESDYWISGVWRPKSAESLDVHDSNAPLPIVGNFGGSWDTLDVLLNQLHEGKLADNGFYTATIMIDQADMDKANRDAYEAKINNLSDAVAKGEITFSTITDTYNTWLTTQQGRATIYHYTETGAPLTKQNSTAPTQNTSASDPKAACGDGVCTALERKSLMCSADCL